VAHLIIGIVGDILRHVAIKDLKIGDVGLTYRTGCTDSSQFVVLLPQIGLDNFGRSQES
jgi:hypothetical protein